MRLQGDMKAAEEASRADALLTREQRLAAIADLQAEQSDYLRGKQSTSAVSSWRDRQLEADRLVRCANANVIVVCGDVWCCRMHIHCDAAYVH